MAARGLAWITGGSSGIGLATAHELSAAGYVVALTPRREDAMQAACSQIEARGGSAIYATADVADAGQVDRAHRDIAARAGPVSVLVNSAGFNIARRDWAEVTTEDFGATVSANLNGTFHAITAVLPAMRAARDGVIVNIASWAGRYVAAGAGPAYTAAKHAVFALTSSLNMAEVVNGIRACALCPGEVDTPIMDARTHPPTPQQRAAMLGADDVARLIRIVVELPPSVLLGELVLTPTGIARG
jgi:NADP-dependent 3-hydroxy acid dehydrogenase YdfG